jgi:hypothetical protein
MRKSFLIILIVAFFVVGCNTIKTDNSTAKKEDNPYTRKITAEEKGYILLVLNKDYDNLEAQTQNQSNELQNDYYNIAYAFKTFQEAQQIVPDEKNKDNFQEIQMKYYSIERALKDVKYIPDKIKKQIEDVKNTSIKQDKYYSKFVDKQVDE